MLELLWLIPALPLAGFVLLFATGGRLPARAVACLGAGSVGLSALLALFLAYEFVSASPLGNAYSQTLWVWMGMAGFSPSITFYLDPLSLVMMLVVTVVGFLIHVYSTEFMAGDEGYNRFFASMNLFVAFMLTLVLAGDLLVLFLGWEGVGLCSYLLIGHWYREADNGRAARKAFIVTRIGDTAMLIALLLLFTQLGSTDIEQLMQRAAQQWPVGSGLAVAAAALLLGGAVGKSAQLPLQIWLPDAMAGPTPVSALIHAATMVTAGVYLIARTHVLYGLAPVVQSLVAAVGALTLLLAAAAALAQTDIKRILAYSTISQIGYMFLALGLGAWPAAIFHFMTHAFFKALLFLAAGAVILSLHEEHDIFRMGGLRRRLPLAFWTFLIGSASLAALPLVTAGFYSKDLILWHSWSSPIGNVSLWVAGLFGAFLTAVYIFRPVFVVFFGDVRTEPAVRHGMRMNVPLIVLGVLALLGGLIDVPSFLNGPYGVSEEAGQGGESAKRVIALLASALSLLGIYLAYRFFLASPHWLEQLMALRRARQWQRFLLSGLGFDKLYEIFLVRPFLWTVRVNRNDFIDAFYDGVALFSRLSHQLLSRTQNGELRWYATGIAAGAVVLVLMAISI